MLSDRVAFDKIYNKSAAHNNRGRDGALANVKVNARTQKLHNDHADINSRKARAAFEKEKAEEEEAFMLSQQPLKYVHEDQVRTLEQFMDDQIRFEQRRFENLKSAIIREESEET